MKFSYVVLPADYGFRDTYSWLGGETGLLDDFSVELKEGERLFILSELGPYVQSVDGTKEAIEIAKNKLTKGSR